MSIFGFGAIGESHRKVREQQIVADADAARRKAHASRLELIDAQGDLNAALAEARRLESELLKANAQIRDLVYKRIDEAELSVVRSARAAGLEAVARETFKYEQRDGDPQSFIPNARLRKIFVDAVRNHTPAHLSDMPKGCNTQEEYRKLAEELLLGFKVIDPKTGEVI
jgi:hypothetical protein